MQCEYCDITTTNVILILYMPCYSILLQISTNCKRKCPSGESPECPFDEHCFSLTPCTEEKGYPEDYGFVPEVSGDCVPFQVTIVADHWPKETSWEIINTQVEDEIIAEGSSDDLVPGEPVQFLECVNNKNGCYEFRINGKFAHVTCNDWLPGLSNFNTLQCIHLFPKPRLGRRRNVL